MNTWPGGVRHAMHQSDHESWNARNYPGTRQLCAECEEPTGRCEDDSIYADDDHEIGPLCVDCWRARPEYLLKNIEASRDVDGAFPDLAEFQDKHGRSLKWLADKIKNAKGEA